MKEAQIKRAKIGDRVKFIPLPGDAGEYSEGTITHKLGQRVEITWDDGETCTMTPHDYTRVFLAGTIINAKTGKPVTREEVAARFQ